MGMRQSVGGRRSVMLYLGVAGVLILAVALAAIVFVVAPERERRQQAETQQAQATATEEARLAEVERSYQAGIAFAEAGDWGRAVEEFTEVITLEPDYGDVATRLAEAREKVTSANATLTAEAAATATAETEAVYQRGLGYLNLERWEQAKAEFEQVIAADPSYKDVQTKLAEVEARLAEIRALTPTATPVPTATPTITNTPTSPTSHAAPAAANVPSDGLIAYYSFDDGTATDNSGNGNDGVIYGNPLVVSGIRGRAFSFDGGNDYIEVSDDDTLDLTNKLTISLWVNQRAAQRQGYRLIDKITAGYPDGYMFDTYGNGTSGRRMRLSGAGVRGNFNSGNTWANSDYSLNTRHHLLVVFSNGLSLFYLDGDLDGAGAHGLNSMQANSLTLRIGVPHGSTKEFFNGILDEIRIYDRALSEDEIQALYQQGASD